MVASCHVDHFGIPLKCCDKSIRLLLLLLMLLYITKGCFTFRYQHRPFMCFQGHVSGVPQWITKSLSVEVRSPPNGRTRVPGLTSIGQWRSTDLRHGQCICSSDVIRCSGDMGYGPWPVPMPCPSNKFEVFAQNACSIPIIHFMKIHEL